MSIAEKLTTIAENTPKVYDAGYSKAESDFWDLFTDYGKRDFYEYGFTRSGFEYIRPTRKIVPTSRSICMFEGASKLKRVEKAYFDLSKGSITTQGAGTGGNYCTFRCISGVTALEVIEDIGMQAGGYYQTFWGDTKLHTIEVLRVREDTNYSATFNKCYELVNLTIEGTIGRNSFDVSYSPKLSHDSLMSIINALKDYSEDTSGTSWVVTLGTTNIAKLTDAEKAIATEKGWTLA